MSSENYVDWCPVSNTVKSRLKDNSLAHTFTSERKIRKSTKLINTTLEQKLCKTTYTQFKQCKQKILNQLTENSDVFNKSDTNVNYYKTYYDSFDTSLTNIQPEGYLWQLVDKKVDVKDESDDESEDLEPLSIWEPKVYISEIQPNKNFKKLYINKSKRKEQVTKSSSTIRNKEVSSANSKVIIRKNVSTKEKQSPKPKLLSNKSLKSVKKNLTSALDNANLRSQDVPGDEWNEDFAAAEFQAHSTQIFSDTFSEKKPNTRFSINRRSSRDIIHQPRDSGIEEDSREDNIKFENPADKTAKEKNTDNLKLVDNNEIKKSPNKKVPLKIIGEEMVTKKFKIINNKNKETKPIIEEKKAELLKTELTKGDIKASPTNKNSESSSESDSEFLDCHNPDDNQCNQSDKGSSEEYFNLEDDNNKEDNQEDAQEHENKKTESDNSSDNESIVYKKQLQEELKRCKSPFMIRRYEELKRSGVLDESDTESQIKLTEDIEKKPKRILITSSKTNEKHARKIFKTPSPQSIPKTQKQVKYDESFEDKTLVAENFNGSLITNGLEENEDDVEADEVEATPKLQQIKKLSLLADNSESEDSQDENICKKAEDRTAQKGRSISPETIKQYHQEIKRTDKQSTYEDSDKSENENKYNKVKESLNSNTLSKQVKETVSLRKGSLQNTSKSNKDYSDSIVSETTNSLSSSKSKRGKKKKENSKELEKLADKNNLSADEESSEISAQSDLENVVDNYKQRLASPIPKLAEDLNESNEPTDIATQFQSMESPDHEDSDDSENSVQEKTVIHLNNKNEMHIKPNTDSDSEKKDDSLKNESPKDNKIKQKAETEESSSEEETSYLEEMRDDPFGANKNEESENECTMSSKSKENLNKIKRLDLLNSDEDSEDSKDGIVEKNHCNSDVDIEEHKIVDILSCDDSQKKGKESLNHLKSNNDDSSDNSETEITSASKSDKSRTKHLSSASLKNSKIDVPDIDDNNTNSSEKKSKRKRKLAKIDSVHESDRESETSQEIDVVHFSSENDVNDQREIKKSKRSNFGASPIAEEENIDTLSPNRSSHTKLSTVTSENGNDDSDSDQDMSYSSKQKILRLKKMNLLTNNDSSSSEDEETIKNSQNKADNRNEAANKNPALSDADSNSDSEKKKDLYDSNVTINKKQNQVKENGDSNGEDDESDIEDQKDNIFDNKNSESKDSEEECTMSSKTKERLNKMKRLDLLNSDEDSDNSEESINDKNKNNNSDVDIEEHKVEDFISHHVLKKNNETKGQESSSDSDSEKNESFNSREKFKESEKKNKIKSKESPKITSKMVAINDAEVNNVFEEEKGEIKENKKSKNKVIIQETQENVNSQKSILESQPMFSSLEDLREGLDEERFNIDIESDVNANTLKDTNQIPPTENTIKKFMDKITKISELVEKESLEKINCQSTMTVNDISPDEDIFMLEVPKTIFNENLVGKKFSFLKTTLTVGNNKFEAVQKKVSPTYSCILKTEKKALDSFTTQNIRPSATIVARRKKFVGESTKITDNEMDEDIQESSTVSDTENLENGNISSKDKNTKIKGSKKGSKKLKKSEEKEVLNLPVKKNKEGSKKVKSNNDIFNIKNFVMKTKATTLDNLEKRNKKKHKKEHISANDPLNHDEISKEKNLHNNLSDFLEETRTQTKVKKAPIKKAVNITPSKGAIPKRPVKSLSKSKKVKPRTEDVEETESVIVTNKKTNTEPVKKSDSKPRLKKRKAEIQTSGDANPDEKQETKKKKKVAAEQKEKKPASKATNSRKLKKKGVNQTGESAAEQIKKLIAKNIKFDDSLNRSFDSSSYNPLDIERVPKKPKRCQSTTSNSSDDENQFTRRSFHVRVKAKPEDGKSTNASSTVDVKNEDKKSVKKVFFAE